MKKKQICLVAVFLALVLFCGNGISAKPFFEREIYPEVILEVPRIVQSSNGCVIASFASAEAYLRGSYGGVTYEFGKDYPWQTPLYDLMLDMMDAEAVGPDGIVDGYKKIPPDNWVELSDISLDNLYKNLMKGKPIVICSEKLGHTSLLIGYVGPYDSLEESGFVVLDVGLGPWGNNVNNIQDIEKIGTDSYPENSCYLSLSDHLLHEHKLTQAYVPQPKASRPKPPEFFGVGAVGITDDNAILWQSHTSVQCSEIGFYLGKETNQMERFAKPINAAAENATFDLKETGCRLTAGTEYTYQTFFVYGGKEYRSGQKTFRTTGTPSPILPETKMLGDADGDGKVTTTDKVLLSRFLAKWDIEIDEKACDLNQNGVPEAAEAVVIARYLAKWSNLPYAIGEWVEINKN